MILEGVATGLSNLTCSTGCGAASSARPCGAVAFQDGRSIGRRTARDIAVAAAHRKYPPHHARCGPNKTNPVVVVAAEFHGMDLLLPGRGRPARPPISDHLPGPEHTMRRAMQGLKPHCSDSDEFAELDAGLEVARDHIGLHHQAHVLLQREGGYRSGRTAV
jgi:hypothetical protein